MIMNISEAIKWRNELKKNGLKLVITNGCFDILHRGHAEYLAKSRECGDVQLVLLNSDSSIRELKGPSRPVIDEYSRAYLLASLKSVDAVVIFSTPRCTEQFSLLSPDVYVKGGDYTLDTLNREEFQALKNVDAKIHFIKFIDGFSTTDIVNKIQTGRC